MRPWSYLGNLIEGRARKSQSAQVNGPASGRDNIDPDLLQRHDVTGLDRPDVSTIASVVARVGLKNSSDFTFVPLVDLVFLVAFLDLPS